MAVVTIQRRSNEYAYADTAGMLCFGLIAGDANATYTQTEPIDLFTIAGLAGLFHLASLQLASEGTAIGTAVATLEASNDGLVFSALTSAATASGASTVRGIDIRGVRWLRARITTGEGAAETCAMHVVCTRAGS